MDALELTNAMLFLSTLSLRRATALALCFCGGVCDFYPRSPCGERRQMPLIKFFPATFLSTLSLRRATYRCPIRSGHNLDFYPRSPCGERQMELNGSTGRITFLSTLSLRRATWPGLLARPFFIISIHALLAESDASQTNLPSEISISIHALLAESDSKSAQNNGALLHI